MTDIFFRGILPTGLAGGIFYLLLLALLHLWSRFGPGLCKGALLAVCVLLLVPLPLLASALMPEEGPTRESLRSAAPLAPAYQAGERIGEAIGEDMYTGWADTTSGLFGAAGSDSPPVSPTPETSEPETPAFPAPTLPQVIALLYFAGLAAVVLTFALRYTRLMRGIRRKREQRGYDFANTVYTSLCAEMGIQRPPTLYHADVSTPLLAGLFRPAIYLPREMAEDETLRLALRHELTHYKNADLLLKFIVLLATAIQWYLPLCPLLLRDFAAACEEACDAGATAGLSGPERQAYAGMLLAYAGAAGASRGPPSACPPRGAS